MNTSTLLIVFLALGFGYLLYEKMKKGEGKESENKLMLDVVEKLRTDLRSGLDKNTENVQGRLDETLKLLNQQFHNSQKSLDRRLDANTKVLNERLDGAAKVIGSVKEELGRMKEVGDQIKNLQDFLRAPKLRGNLGEQVMNDLIQQCLPQESYQFQYSFRSGDIVDAVIITNNGMIPIDAKFPLDNYRKIINTEDLEKKEKAAKDFRKDVKKHINDINKKYIKPDEDTLDFALMYVPADSVYFEIVINDEEISMHAQEKKVHIVSPNSFYYFLKVILIAFQSQKFEESAKQVLGLISGIKKESEKFGDTLSVLGKHVTNAKVKMDEVQSDYLNLDSKITQVSTLHAPKERKPKKITEVKKEASARAETQEESISLPI
ncbi:MAG TPA: DNA recombination protein RmuC [Candidatus Peregrinibacteria bacterium]|nr:DNA recombination protein RmuC [Candidatus Peregrinibacteria bacterium]